jgi:hypothetical protein
LKFGASSWPLAKSNLQQIKKHIPLGNEIALFVLSNRDADHITAAARVFLDYKLKKSFLKHRCTIDGLHRRAEGYLSPYTYGSFR